MRVVSLSYPVSSDIVRGAEPKVAQSASLTVFTWDMPVFFRRLILRGRMECRALITFYPHPKDVIGKGSYEGYLTPQPDKRARQWASIFCMLSSSIRSSPR